MVQTPTPSEATVTAEQIEQFSGITDGLRTLANATEDAEAAFLDLHGQINNATLTSDVVRRLRLPANPRLRDAVQTLSDAVVPGTQIPLFIGGGTYMIVDDNGEIVGYGETKIGRVYDSELGFGDIAEHPLRKIAARMLLDREAKTEGLSDRVNNEYLHGITNKGVDPDEQHPVFIGDADGEATIHTDDDQWIFVGVSGAELSEEAHALLMSHLSDPSKQMDVDNGHYTCAGRFDTLAAELVLNAMRPDPDKPQRLVDEAWEDIMKQDSTPDGVPEFWH